MSKCMVRMIPQSLRLQTYLQLASLSSCHKWQSARRSVCCCNLSGSGASILADRDTSVPRTRIECRQSLRDIRWSVLPTLCSSCKWVGRGGHVASDTRWLGLWAWRWRLSFNIARSLWNYPRYTIIECRAITFRVAHSRERTEYRDTRPYLSYSTSIQVGQEIN